MLSPLRSGRAVTLLHTICNKEKPLGEMFGMSGARSFIARYCNTWRASGSKLYDCTGLHGSLVQSEKILQHEVCRVGFSGVKSSLSFQHNCSKVCGNGRDLAAKGTRIKTLKQFALLLCKKSFGTWHRNCPRAL